MSCRAGTFEVHFLGRFLSRNQMGGFWGVCLRCGGGHSDRDCVVWLWSRGRFSLIQFLIMWHPSRRPSSPLFPNLVICLTELTTCGSVSGPGQPGIPLQSFFRRLWRKTRQPQGEAQQLISGSFIDFSPSLSWWTPSLVHKLPLHAYPYPVDVAANSELLW